MFVYLQVFQAIIDRNVGILHEKPARLLVHLGTHNITSQGFILFAFLILNLAGNDRTLKLNDFLGKPL